MGWRLFDAREEEIRELSIEEKNSKESGAETPVEPGEEAKSSPKSFPCVICNFIKDLKSKLKNLFAKSALFNKMSITEEEKKSLEE